MSQFTTVPFVYFNFFKLIFILQFIVVYLFHGFKICSTGTGTGTGTWQILSFNSKNKKKFIYSKKIVKSDVTGVRYAMSLVF
jgi:hypothetical protein